MQIKTKNLLALSTGTFLEYFDLMIYVHMADVLNEVFFTKSINNYAWYTAFAFCSTFLLKPFGGLFFGYLGDRYGRKSVLISTTTLMAICCMVLSITPSYEEIGFTAAIIVTICRLLQGLSSIGESTSSEIYMAEQTQKPERYYYTGIVAYAGVVGTVAALVVAKIILALGINWRFVFFAGAIIGFIGFYIRVQLHESFDFQQIKKKIQSLGKNAAYAKSLLEQKTNCYNIFAYFCVFCGWPICFYFSYVHCGNILKEKFDFTKEAVIHQNLLLGICNLCGLYFWIHLTKFIHPIKILLAKTVVFVPLMFFIPTIIDTATSNYDIFFLQVMFIVFGHSTIPAKGVFLMYFPTLSRFTWAAFLNGLSHVLLYIITSFGLVYLVKEYSNKGILLIFIPITIIFIGGVLFFRKKEIEQGYYNQ